MQHSWNSRKNQVHLTTILHLGSICETLGHTWLDWEGLGWEKWWMFTEHYCLPQELIIHLLDWYYGGAGSNRWGDGPSCDAYMSSVHWILDYYFHIPLRTPVVCSTGTDTWASQVALAVKNPPSNAGNIKDSSLIPGLGRSPEDGHGNPPQHSCLENPMNRGAWWATVHRVTKSWTRLKQLSMHTITIVCIPIY